MDLPKPIQEALARRFGKAPRIRARRPLSGGMVNKVEELLLDGPPGSLVVKISPEADRLEREGRQLDFLKAESRLPIPETYGFLREGGKAFLFLQKLPGEPLGGLRGAVRAAAERSLASWIVELHRIEGESYGRAGEEESYDSWADWYRARCAEEMDGVRRRLDRDTLWRLETVLRGLDDRLAPEGPPRLVHGDLWATNILVQKQPTEATSGGTGAVVSGLLDPKAEFTDPDFEIAYLEVFHTVGPDFHETYRRAFPEGGTWPARRVLYFLHTMLVHVDRFGDPGYVRAASELVLEAERIVKKI